MSDSCAGRSQRARARLFLAPVAVALVFLAAPPPVPAQTADFSGIYVGSRTVVEPNDFAFTAEGQRTFDGYDRLEDLRRYDDCAPESLTAILLSGLIATMEIAPEEGRIVISFERGDTVRSIDLEGAAPSVNQPNTRVGYSAGRWEDGVLIIETTRLTAGLLLQNRGYAISDQARITERYWRNPEENDLQMELVVEDPVNYTEPLTFGREWTWSPEEEVRGWNCIPLGTRDSEPVDIETLRQRLLEQ